MQQPAHVGAQGAARTTGIPAAPAPPASIHVLVWGYMELHLNLMVGWPVVCFSRLKETPQPHSLDSVYHTQWFFHVIRDAVSHAQRTSSLSAASASVTGCSASGSP